MHDFSQNSRFGMWRDDASLNKEKGLNRGWRKRERERKVIKGFCEKIINLAFCKKYSQSSITHKALPITRTHQALPSVSIHQSL